MKKAILILVAGLLFSGNAYAGYNLTLFFVNMSVMYGSIKELNIFNHVRKI